MLHIAISSAAVLIFLRKAPFTIYFKLLFIFGYFIFFEYNLISRNYNLGILFLFAALSFYEYRKSKFIIFCLLLGLANNTHAIFLVATSSIVFIELLDTFRSIEKNNSLRYYSGLSIFFLLTTLALVQIIPPPDTTFFQRGSDISIIENITRSAVSFFKGIVAIPDFRTLQFWNSHFIINVSKPTAAILSAFSLFVPALFFHRNRLILLYSYLAILGTMVFFFVTQLSAYRYFGIHYLIIVVGLWMEQYHSRSTIGHLPFIPSTTLKKAKNILIYSILVLHLISGVISYSIDLAHPFSGSKQTIQFLRDNGLDKKEIITKWCGGTSLSSYLKKPIYFASLESYQSYCAWDYEIEENTLSDGNLISAIEKRINKESQSVIYISLVPLDLSSFKSINESVQFNLLERFIPSVVNKGSYYIYEVSK